MTAGADSTFRRIMIAIRASREGSLTRRKILFEKAYGYTRQNYCKQAARTERRLAAIHFKAA
jgi:hypothetical protein